MLLHTSKYTQVTVIVKKKSPFLFLLVKRDNIYTNKLVSKTSGNVFFVLLSIVQRFKRHITDFSIYIFLFFPQQALQ